MQYVMSDLHGCFHAYQAALEAIGFSDRDTLYVLGDVLDRGTGPISILQDMMLRPNVVPILGNHEFMALSVLRRLAVTVTEDNAEGYLTTQDLTSYSNWMLDGGHTTVQQFRALDTWGREDVLDYLGEFSLYEETEAAGKRFVLIHGGPHPFVPGKALEDYSLPELIFHAPDYDRVYFPDRYLVTGHTPTLRIPGCEGRILTKNRHIAIDCGCVFGGRLGVYCLDTGETIYIQPQQEDLPSYGTDNPV